MKKFLSALLIFAAFFDARLDAQTTAFTYQGRLNDQQTSANGSYDFQFSLFDAAADGNQVGTTLAQSIVVSNGLFTTHLDFGNPFTAGTNFWLNIAVATNGAGILTPLTPRQPITPTPLALFAATAASVQSIGASNLTGTIPLASLPSSVVTNGGTFSGTLNGNGAGVTNVNAATVNGLGANSFWKLGGNNSTAGQFLGTRGREPFELWVNNQRALRIEPGDSDSPNIVGGYLGNSIGQNGIGRTIAGGGTLFLQSRYGANNVLADYGTISGGAGNTAGADSTVSGGQFNTATGVHSVIAGGFNNTVSGYGAVIGGGTFNTNSGPLATVSGGDQNSASGDHATVPGGGYNSASGKYSFAAGYNANATNQGSFVWADNHPFAFYSTADNQFAIRAQNGVYIRGTGGNQLLLQEDGYSRGWKIYTETFNDYNQSGNLLFVPSPTTGAFGFINKNNGTYASSSDIRLKKDIQNLEPVLDRLMQLRPVSYRFRKESESAPLSLGLVAQEVEPLFPEVVSEHAGMKSLAYSELVPVTIQAIQELNEKFETQLREKDAQLEELQRDNESLKIRLERIERLVSGRRN